VVNDKLIENILTVNFDSFKTIEEAKKKPVEAINFYIDRQPSLFKHENEERGWSGDAPGDNGIIVSNISKLV
jgi:hypothetical protein